MFKPETCCFKTGALRSMVKLAWNSLICDHIVTSASLHPTFSQLLLTNEVLDDSLVLITRCVSLPPPQWLNLFREIGRAMVYAFVNSKVHTLSYYIPYNGFLRLFQTVIVFVPKKPLLSRIQPKLSVRMLQTKSLTTSVIYMASLFYSFFSISLNWIWTLDLQFTRPPW